MEYNHADLFEGVADAIGDRVALICGDQRLTYAELDEHANRLAHHLADAGVRPGQHVAVQLYNGVEYAAALLATLKIRAVPINVNYRYVENELFYVYRDSGVALLYDVEFEDKVAATVPEVPELRHLIAVGGTPSIPGAVAYDEALRDAPGTRGFPARSGETCTSSTRAGRPGCRRASCGRPSRSSSRSGTRRCSARRSPRTSWRTPRNSGPLIMMPVAPLMHGAAQVATFIAWFMGATLVYTRKFDAADVWATIEREKVNSLTITGDAMAIPMAEELARGEYDTSSLFAYVSTGAIFTGTVRDRIQKLLPNVMILDRFGSTESGSTAEAVAGSTPEKGLRFAPDVENVTVLDDAFQQVKPGSGVIGRVARTGYIAQGYYNDPEKRRRRSRWWTASAGCSPATSPPSRRTARSPSTAGVPRRSTRAARRCSRRRSRPSSRGIRAYDAVVTGIPDERWGDRVAAVIQPSGDAPPSDEELDAHCRRELSGYKVPRVYAFVDEMKRSLTGKADYRWAKQVAEEAQ